MAKYVPTDAQRAAFKADHKVPEAMQSVIKMITTGKGIERALIRYYITHDVDTSGLCDTVAVFAMDIVSNGRKIRGHGKFAFNLVNGVPIAADYRDFQVSVPVSN